MEASTAKRKKLMTTTTKKLKESERSSPKKDDLPKCSLCSYIGKNLFNLQYHTLSVHKTYKYLNFFKCSFCPYKSIFKRKYLRHIAGHRRIVINVYCAHCPFVSKGKQNLKRHLLGHLVKAKFKCSYCTYSATRESTIAAHKWLHPEHKRDSFYQCTLCPYWTRIRYHFQRHQIVHQEVLENNNVATFHCEQCPFLCYYKSSLARHRMGHSTNNAFKCYTCSFSTSSKRGLNSHMKCHVKIDVPKDDPDRKFKCTTCAYQTNKKYHFERHLNTHTHQKQRSLCKRETKLIKHEIKSTKQNSPEPQKRIFACPTCSYATFKRADLKRHCIQHQPPEDIQWFKCDQCPFKAKRKYQLTTHKVNHELSDGFKCLYCSFRSLTEAMSLRHMKLHL